MKNKAILIIDAQKDFINGTLPVENAEDKMNRLSYHLHNSNGEYLLKIFTTDWHPFFHCSFKENGGEWPSHCVQNSEGASIWTPLLKESYLTKGKTVVLRKGDSESVDEYSIFDNFKSCQKLKELIASYHIEEIDICGIAGDICVLNSLKGGLENLPDVEFNVLKKYVPSIDGGAAIKKFATETKKVNWV